MYAFFINVNCVSMAHIFREPKSIKLYIHKKVKKFENYVGEQDTKMAMLKQDMDHVKLGLKQD